MSGAALIGIVSTSFLPISPATAQVASPPAPIDVSSFCANAPELTDFRDVADDSTFVDEIICLKLTGVTQGVTARTFAPGAAVTRGQMASFIARLIDAANRVEIDPLTELDDAPPEAFTDVDDASPHAVNIDRLAAAGIALGGPGNLADTEFGPGLPVNRAQMAMFINRAIGFLTGDALATTNDYFTDVDAGSVSSDDVNAVASAGIAVGVGGNLYRPGLAVVRQQMSAFIVRALASLEAAGAIAPEPPAADAEFQANLGQLNDSGATGTATVEVEGDMATVTVDISGTSAELPHAQHIHIGGTSSCPTIAEDDDADGFISTTEGADAYGGIAVSLTTAGDVTAASALAVDRMPAASDAGVVTYARSFRLPEGVQATDVANGVIVSHGIADTTLGTDPAVYDGPDSELAAGVPMEATLPSACGALGSAPGPQTFDTTLAPLNGSGATGTASVEVNGNLATVIVGINGTSANLPHAQHIHIGGTSSCPTIAEDDDGDGLISTTEGADAYGGIAVSLTTEGDVTPASALALERMPAATDTGGLLYGRTFILPAGVRAIDVANGVIVSHGIAETALSGGTDPAVYDGDDSELAAGVPMEATLPSACGALSLS